MERDGGQGVVAEQTKVLPGLHFDFAAGVVPSLEDALSLGAAVPASAPAAAQAPTSKGL